MKVALSLFGSFLCCLLAFQPSPRASLHISTRQQSIFLPSAVKPTNGITDPTNNISEPSESPINPPRRLLDMALSLIGSTTSVAVSLTFFAFLAWNRDALMVTFFIGSIGNGILSKVLKKLINQTRPTELASEASLRRKPTDNGMPSSHAMSLGFIATFTALLVPSTAALLVVYTLVSLYYRIQVNLHTWQQVLVGLTAGSANGFVWHWLCRTTALLDWVRDYFLGADGLLPVPMLIVPVLLGAMTVGSFERRISDLMWWKKKTSDGSSKDC